MKKWLLLISLSSVFCLAQKVSKGKLHIQKIDSLGNTYLELNRFSGVIAISKNESLIYYKDFGFANYSTKEQFTRNSTFNIGNISEVITKQIVLQLAKDQKINLNQKIKKYLTKLKADFTIKDLLEHKTYLPNLSSVDKSLLKKKGSVEKLINSISIIKDYSSRGGDLEYILLNRLIEKVIKKEYSEVVLNLSKGMRLNNTISGESKFGSTLGYSYSNYNSKGLELNPILKNKSRNFEQYQIHSSAIDVVQLISKINDEKIKIDGYIDGFSYAVENSFKKNISIVILSNRNHPVGKEMLGSIKSILENTEYRLPLLRKEVVISKDLLKEYIGEYELNESMTFRVKEKGAKLYVFFGDEQQQLYAQSSNQFYIKDKDAAIRFERDKKGKVIKVILLDGFITGQEAKKK